MSGFRPDTRLRCGGGIPVSGLQGRKRTKLVVGGAARINYYADLSDEELLALVADGRPEALEAVYDRYSRQTYALALRILCDREASEEVVQDTFVAVWRRAASYQASVGRPYSWLFKITRNRAIDELRRRRSGGQRISREGGRLPDLPEVAEEDGHLSELGSPMVRALKGLPPEQREVLELSYFGGFSQREISERTGTPLGTVKTRARLALKKLRKALQSPRKSSMENNEL